MGKRFEREYEVHYYDVDVKLQCKIESIINYFTDIGTKQSEKIGVGIEYMSERNLAWVFCKYDIKINRYPKYGEKIRVATNALGFKRFYASRLYEIFDEEGNKIVEAIGVFLLIDINKRRAVRIPLEQYEFYGVSEDEECNINVSKPEKLKEEMHSKEFKVRYSDIDSNTHVNNVKYIEWALESVPVEILYNNNLVELSVVFEKECSYGDEIKSICEVKENDEEYIILHKIENNEGKELTTLISKWVK
ncbi:acyl-[acyl-carrier-protein] thioesterase [Clostridium sp. NSJ-6]|uniref:Acyl-[acyl-carrier-protein] thioesterase n=1 Tax=Clostridium hominis TaxID=2763036 RepID=A0ABR7DB57_9CLOT|nr:acyl-ACP thioesterase domain-containing protein [Clostridium hominis]MBC5628635.1 acyl-[acyl-carrier-protein] thioesterase [Clostridium hominis]